MRFNVGKFLRTFDEEEQGVFRRAMGMTKRQLDELLYIDNTVSGEFVERLKSEYGIAFTEEYILEDKWE